MRRKLSQLGVLALSPVLVLCFTPAEAHEFWIDPVTFTPAVSASVPIVFRIGSNFRGDTYPYVRKLDRGFRVVSARGEQPVKAIDGDDPATDIKLRDRGLTIIWHRRAPETVDFATMAAFEETLVDEGLEAIGSAHRAANRPLVKIKESFARCAKALLQVGGGELGADRPVGLPLEIVAETNPYVLQAGGKLSIRLLLEGAPLSDALVKVFHQLHGEHPLRIRTDKDGRVTFDATQAGEYLISAVHMRTALPSEGVDYASQWATLTFKRPPPAAR